MSATPVQSRPGFDPLMAGKHAECDGGGGVAGTKYAGREEFAGTLTGEYIDHGEPPWRWYLMTDLTQKPDSYTESTVWCQAGSIFFTEDKRS